MQEQILAYLKAHSAQRLLWLSSGPAPAELTTDYRPLRPGLGNELQGEHFDCAVVTDLPGPLERIEAEALIAQLRDVVTQRILWVIGFESPWERQDLLALGFRQLDEADGDKLFGYDIDNYKQTPDWLSPKNWANPERWDKDRW